MLKIFPVILMLAGIAVIAGGFRVSAHSVDGGNIMKILSHCDNAESPDKKPQKTESGSGGISNIVDKFVAGAKETAEKIGKKTACAAAKKDLDELKTEVRALIVQIDNYIRLFGRGVSLFGIVLVLIGASNLAAVWRK